MSAQESESPWLIDYLRMRAVNTTLSPAEARAVATLYDTAIAQRDAAVRERDKWKDAAKLRDNALADVRDGFAEALGIPPTPDADNAIAHVRTLRAKLAAAEADRDRYRKWLSDVDNAERERFTSALAAHHLAFVTPRTPTPPQEATNDE